MLSPEKQALKALTKPCKHAVTMAKFFTLRAFIYGTPPVTLNPHLPGLGYQEAYVHRKFHYYLLCVNGVVASF